MGKLIFRPEMRRQAGISLVMTLIILVVITLSSLAMVVSMRAGISAAGNIAFSQAAVRVADVGVKAAYDRVKALIEALRTALNDPSTAEAYYVVHNDATGCTAAIEFAPESYDFMNPNCARELAQTSNFRIFYVIHRLSTAAGQCSGAAGCQYTPQVETTSTEGGTKPLPTTNSQFVYYRVTVKVVGPRNNNRYVQALIY
jgi:Tfp pilus assembly protein PilX